MSIFSKMVPSWLKHGWNVFSDKNQIPDYDSYTYYTRPDRPKLTKGNDRTIVNSIFNRIALDVAALSFHHIKVDDEGQYIETIDSPLEQCLTIEANIDQTGRALIHDAVLSMLDEGCVAIVPVDTSFDPSKSDSYKIWSMRTGKITNWRSDKVTVNLYNEKTGQHQEVTLPKKMVTIIENPLYSVINEPNSTMQRLIRKLSLSDSVDEENGAGKLDLIIQLPYTIKTEARRKQAETRRKDIETQLKGSKYGIAYTDSTERVIQLNRSLENNLMKQIEYLTSMLYSQLGITQAILDGTANEQTMLNYYNQTIEPIASAIVDEMKRKFLTKTARTQLQTIKFFRDPFKTTPVSQIAEIADKFTRNEILSSNEIRQIIGRKPSDDPRANQLRNSNLNHPEDSSTDQSYDEEYQDYETNEEYQY